jgi:S-adenosylmethionine decarboxylase
MAFNDTLFQLGMDLTRSSTAQKEDHSCTEFVSDTADRDSEPARTGHKPAAGHTLFIDLHGARQLADKSSAERAMKRAVESLGYRLKSVHFDPVLGGGVSGVAVLTTGHLSIQSCARSGVTSVDARGCAGLTPEQALIVFAKAFEAREAVIQKARRSNAVVTAPVRLVPNQARSAVKPRGVARAA